jgi:MFS transporter, FSR family, fosmidomycin resistance protein
MESTGDLDRVGRGPLIASLFLFPMGHMAVETYNSMLSIMWPLLATRFALTYGPIGLLTTLFRAGMSLPQLAFAHLADRHGSRWLAIGGLLVMAGGMSLVGLAPSVAVLAVILCLAPLGSAAYHPAATAYVTQTMPRRRGLAVAVLMVGGYVGLALGPLIGAWLYGRHGVTASPWLLPIGLVAAAAMVMWIPQGGASRPARAGQVRGAIPRRIFLLMGAIVCQAWLESAFIAYMPLLLTKNGALLTLPSRMLFLESAGGVLGLVVSGALSDRMARPRVIMLAQLMSVPFYIASLLAGGQWVLLTAAGLGFALTLSQPASVALGQEMMPDRLSLASALTMGVSGVIGYLGITVTGFLADRIGMPSALAINTGLPVLALACMFVLRRLVRPAPRPASQVSVLS